MYLTRQDALQVISRMQDFESQLKSLFGEYNYDLHENIGRRNMLLSAIQEKETARVRQAKFISFDMVSSPNADFTAFFKFHLTEKVPFFPFHAQI